MGICLKYLVILLDQLFGPCCLLVLVVEFSLMLRLFVVVMVVTVAVELG